MPLSYEGVYQATRTIVLVAGERLSLWPLEQHITKHSSGKSQWIFDKLRFELKECVKHFANHLATMPAPNGVDWLSELVEGAAWFNSSIMTLESVLTYLDRVYLLQKSETPSIRYACLYFCLSEFFLKHRHHQAASDESIQCTRL